MMPSLRSQMELACVVFCKGNLCHAKEEFFDDSGTFAGEEVDRRRVTHAGTRGHDVFG